jgi:hypothetical protein
MSSEQQSGAQKPDLARQEVGPSWLQLVRKHVESLKFGTVQITVPDSQVTEVVRAEKTRLERTKPSGTGTNQTTRSYS